MLVLIFSAIDLAAELGALSNNHWDTWDPLVILPISAAISSIDFLILNSLGSGDTAWIGWSTGFSIGFFVGVSVGCANKSGSTFLAKESLISWSTGRFGTSPNMSAPSLLPSL